MIRVSAVARGDAPSCPASLSTSPLPGVSDAAWARFLRAMVVAPLGAVSASGALGRYEMRPRRLVEIGLAENLRSTARPGQCNFWRVDFFPPQTEAGFLANEAAQDAAFAESVRQHDGLASGSYPAGLSRAGALALLHCAGAGGLRSWAHGERFERTVAVVTRVNGIF